MELIYFISGILTVGIVYGINLLRHVKSSHTELLAKYQSQSNISSIRYGDLGDDLKAVEDLVMDIQTKMEKDQYATFSEINKTISEVKALAVSNKDKALKTEINQNNDIAKAFTEIQTMKNQIRALGEDPNFISRY